MRSLFWDSDIIDESFVAVCFSIHDLHSMYAFSVRMMSYKPLKYGIEPSPL